MAVDSAASMDESDKAPRSCWLCFVTQRWCALLGSATTELVRANVPRLVGRDGVNDDAVTDNFFLPKKENDALVRNSSGGGGWHCHGGEDTRRQDETKLWIPSISEGANIVQQY